MDCSSSRAWACSSTAPSGTGRCAGSTPKRRGASGTKTMTIKRTLILHGVIIIGLLALMGMFAVHDVGTLTTSSRYMEIQEGLNASFLQMRLYEKNYFLFKDDQAMRDILSIIKAAGKTLDSFSDAMIPAIGEAKYQALRNSLSQYEHEAQLIAESGTRDVVAETTLREFGRRLLELSTRLTREERAKIDKIITKAKRGMLASFLIFLVLAVFLTPLIYRRIFSSMKKVTMLARDISKGRFRIIDGKVPDDEMGTVITAMNSMSQELRLREDELVQSKKLGSLGVLTAGVAHEITNPLNNISMIAQTYQEMYDMLPREKRIEFMDQVLSECERIRAIVVNLLDFAKPKVASFSPGDINEVINRTLGLVQNMLDVSDIEVHLDLDSGIPTVNMDKHQINQVFVNIITNAIQAMKPGQDLTIRTTTTEKRDEVHIVIEDTGKGMSPETLSHIFDPFFSTKGVDGTGLGLSVSYGIVKNHSGTITASSEVDKGTTFEIHLPATPQMEDTDE
ncbi:two-component sensor histidine kinase [Oceanidesulfovibrio marinus]|uniref:histidine kinase n=2 Tax=Oceanidesulfovibrio marinus TaxID=370038 RepID=A0A6P1ZI22_9BACT|nr:two-component sensor histidine kinase [Oceanidesulfovibrio marinus]